ncbi:MAG: tyrosine-type recombinase/integrase [Candidatus Binataceae bacterium]|jgi:integrase
MIKKIGDRWRIDYRDSEGHRHEKTFDTRKDADRELIAIKGALHRGEYVTPAKIPTFAEAAEIWFKGKAGRRPGTIANWRAQIDRYLKPRFGRFHLDQIDVSMIENARDEWIAGRAATEGDKARKPLQPRSVSALLVTASAIFKLAMKHKRCRVNPVADAERPFIGSREITSDDTKDDRGDDVRAIRPDEVPSPDEVRRMLAEAKAGFYRTLFSTAAMTGMRSGELFALRWTAIELPTQERGKVFVRQTLTWAREHGEKGSPRAKFYPPKTKAGIRTIPIPAALVATLRAWKLACPPSDLDLVFPTVDGQPTRRSDALRYGLWPALRRAGLRQMSMHALRHFFASVLIASRAPVTEVQALLGHSNPGTTLKIYSHWFKDVETGSVDRVADVLAGDVGDFLETSGASRRLESA